MRDRRSARRRRRRPATIGDRRTTGTDRPDLAGGQGSRPRSRGRGRRRFFAAGRRRDEGARLAQRRANCGSENARRAAGLARLVGRVRETEELLNFPWDNEAATIEQEAADELLREGRSSSAAGAETGDAGRLGAAGHSRIRCVQAGAARHAGIDRAGSGVPSSSCRLVLGSATMRGRVRERNEDSFLVQHCTWSNLDQRQDLALIVVADGMGGHLAGDRASGLVIWTMSGLLSPLLTTALSGQATPAALAETLANGLQEANRVVRQAAQDNADCKGMGSTAVALLLWGDRAVIGLVGDCRVYHARAGKLTQVTRDQTLVARMVELGQLTPEEAEKHPRRNEVSQAIGKYALLEPASYDVGAESRRLAGGELRRSACARHGSHDSGRHRQGRYFRGRSGESSCRVGQSGRRQRQLHRRRRALLVMSRGASAMNGPSRERQRASRPRSLTLAARLQLFPREPFRSGLLLPPGFPGGNHARLLGAVRLLTAPKS